jgi:hypothetical protein
VLLDEQLIHSAHLINDALQFFLSLYIKRFARIISSKIFAFRLDRTPVNGKLTTLWSGNLPRVAAYCRSLKEKCISKIYREWRELVSLGFALFDEMEGVENFPEIPLSGRNVSELRPSRRNVSEGSHPEPICEAKTVRLGAMEREM